MTGVGRQTSASSDSGSWGLGGLPPSVVERPEIVLEGIFVTKTFVEGEQEMNPDENIHGEKSSFNGSQEEF